jgi:hypothetical protein
VVAVANDPHAEAFTCTAYKWRPAATRKACGAPKARKRKEPGTEAMP